ncbi:hypothetical protein STPH2_0624 [Streptomyces sp. KO7888]|nr:hypothetical protein [Streptomyces sp. KO7888]
MNSCGAGCPSGSTGRASPSRCPGGRKSRMQSRHVTCSSSAIPANGVPPEPVRRKRPLRCPSGRPARRSLWGATWVSRPSKWRPYGQKPYDGTDRQPNLPSRHRNGMRAAARARGWRPGACVGSSRRCARCVSRRRSSGPTLLRAGAATVGVPRRPCC